LAKRSVRKKRQLKRVKESVIEKWLSCGLIEMSTVLEAMGSGSMKDPRDIL
jgi:hypothetical protein